MDFKELSPSKIQIHNFHMSIMHRVYSPKCLHKHCFQFLLGFTKNLKTILMQNFRGQTRCIMVHVKVVNNRTYALYW